MPLPRGLRHFTFQWSASGNVFAGNDSDADVNLHGWDGSAYRHLAVAGKPIEDWAGNETADFTGGNGVDDSRTEPGPSLFLTQQ